MRAIQVARFASQPEPPSHHNRAWFINHLRRDMAIFIIQPSKYHHISMFIRLGRCDLSKNDQLLTTIHSVRIVLVLLLSLTCIGIVVGCWLLVLVSRLLIFEDDPFISNPVHSLVCARVNVNAVAGPRTHSIKSLMHWNGFILMLARRNDRLPSHNVIIERIVT